MSTLSETPDLALKNIMEYSGLQSILTLRKVSHGFRDFIDNVVPEVYLEIMEVFLDSEKVTNKNWMSNSEIVCASYEKDGESCLITSLDKTKLLVETEYLEQFFDDFKIGLKHQKSKFRNFFIYVDRKVKKETADSFFGELKKILENQQLKVECLNIGVIDPKDALLVLPLINPKFLRTIHFFISKYMNKPLDLTEAAKLDQWKNVDDVSLRTILVTSKVEDFAHFSKINVDFDTLNAEDLVVLKEAAMKNPKFERFQIRYQNFNDIGRIVSFMGPSSYIPMNSTGNEKKHWFFKIPRNEKYLEIQLFKTLNSIEYNLTEKAKIPTGAKVF